jgi:chorismate synthase
MAGNSYGKLFKITTFGESHGKAIGVVIDGCPAGLPLSIDEIQVELNKRRPGQSKITTERNESDTAEILSGVFEGKTTGSPISIIIQNNDHRSADYSEIQNTFRPSHADFTYQEKYGHRDYRGGGRSSARETAARVAAGAVAKKMLQHFAPNLSINTFVSRVENISIDKDFNDLDFTKTETNIVRCPDEETANKMIALIEKTKEEGNTLGGIMSCVVENCPIGLGEPVFDKLHAELAKAMLSINAVKGFEYGSGFEGTKLKGSKHNDVFQKVDNKIKTITNHSGGIQGGISNGMPINFNVAFKPVATIMQAQESIDKSGNKTTLQAKGRHDPCVLPRAVPIVEAMTALVLADFYLRSLVSKC